MSSSAGTPRYRRADHTSIAKFVPQGGRVLDVGCGDGELMELLMAECGARCQGLELSQGGVNRCVTKGLSVVQGDADKDLPVYPDDGFDCAILSKTIQEMPRPAFVLQELSRIARRVVVSFRNYGHWRSRLSLLLAGRAPVLGNQRTWHAEGAHRICSALDIADLADELGLTLVDYEAVSAPPLTPRGLFWLNLLGEEIVLVLERRNTEATPQRTAATPGVESAAAET